MDFKDTYSLTMRAETQAFDKSLDELNKQAKDLKSTLAAIEKDGGKGSENWKKYKAELDAVNKEVTEMSKNIKTTDLTYGQLENSVKKLTKELKGLTPDTEAFVNKSKELQEVKARFEDVKKQVAGVQTSGEALAQPTMWGKISNGVTTVKNAFNAFILLGIVQAIYDIGKSVFETSAKFEKYEKVLENATGSQATAKSSMQALTNLAKGTVFTVDELTEGYVKMVNRGLRPSQAEMIKLADLAASQGKTFDQLVEAVLDAQTGEFERLKEFGIKAKKEGENVSLSFKGQTQVVKNNEEAIYQAMIAMGAMTGVAGSNAKQMETLGGKSSNLTDSFQALMKMLGEKLKPVFEGILVVLNYTIVGIGYLVKGIESVILGLRTYFVSFSDLMVGGVGILKNLGLAVTAFMTGNVGAAGEYLSKAKAGGVDLVNTLKANVTKGVTDIKSVWVSAETAGKLADKNLTDSGKKTAKELTDAQKKELEERRKNAEKHAEDVRKANEASIKAILKAEDEAYVAKIKREQGELAAEKVKLQQSLDAELLAINTSKAAYALKEQQKKLALDKYHADLKTLDTKALEEQKKNQEEQTKKQTEEAKKRLEAEKTAMDNIQRAEKALLDWKELNAKGNAQKLMQIRKEQLDNELKWRKEQLEAERRAEEDKARASIQNTEQLTTALRAIDDRFKNELMLAETKHQQAVTDLTAKEIEARTKKREGYSDALQKLGNLDLQGFVDQMRKQLETHADHMSKREQGAVRLSAAVASIMRGDVQTFTDLMTQQFKVDEDHRNKRLEGFSKTASQIGTAAVAAVNFLNNLTQQRLQKELSSAEREKNEKIRKLDEQLEQNLISKDEYEQEKAGLDADYRKKEVELKRKAWEADKKAQIATALISGAQSVLKALASGIFPLNLVFAALAGVLTAVQIAKIRNQPAPQFHHGFVPQGGKHGKSYGDGGIALVDRRSGREVGEMEGGEAIVSAEQTELNRPLLERMFMNARRGIRKPLSMPLASYGAGGILEDPYWNKGMYLFGTKKKKREAEAAAREAEMEASRAASEADSAGSSAGSDSFDAEGSGYSGSTPSAGADTAAAEAAAKQAEEKANKQLELLEGIKAVAEKQAESLSSIMNNTGDTLNATRAVADGVGRVESAIRSTAQENTLKQLISAVSNMGGATKGE